MDDDDIEEWVSVKKADEKKEETMNVSIALIPDDDDATTNADAIKSYPDQDLLNNMDKIPEEKFLFAFSLAYIKSRKYARKFIEQERVVAVWPDDWSELQITLPIVGHCVANLTSKFKADSIY
jgi:predicted flavoprotein YhiN